MKKFGIIVIAVLSTLSSACVSGERLASSDRVEAIVMNPPPPSADQCNRAQWLSENGGQSLSQADQQSVNSILRRCAGITRR